MVLVLKKGKSYQLKTAEDLPADMLTFKTSKKTVVTVSATGKLKAKKNGTATVTISLKSDPKVKVTVKVTVGTPIKKVKLSKTKLTLKKGKSTTLKFTLSPGKPSYAKVVWTSSDPKVVKVSSKGKVTAVGKGTCTITCLAADGSGKKATCKITVK